MSTKQEAIIFIIITLTLSDEERNLGKLNQRNEKVYTPQRRTRRKVSHSFPSALRM